MLCFTYEDKPYNIDDLLSVIKGKSKLPIYIDEDFNIFSDILLEDLDISDLQKRKFQENNIYTLKQFQSRSKDEILSIDRIGVKIYERLKELCENTKYELLEIDWDENFYNLREKIIVSKISRLSLISVINVISDNRDYINWGNIQIKDLPSLKGIDKQVRNVMLNYLKKNKKGNLTDIDSYIDLDVFDRNYLKLQLDKLIEGEKIYQEDDTYYFRHISIVDYLDSRENDREVDFFIYHVKGKTLQTIGENNDLTRERVRQIIKKFIQSLPEFYEDRFGKFFSKYICEFEAFREICGGNKFAYDYLIYIYGKGEYPLIESLNDEKVSNNMKEKIENYLQSEYLFLDGITIHDTEDSVLNYLLRKYFKEKRNIKELAKLYDEFIKKYDLTIEPVSTLKNFAAKIERRLDVLYSQGKMVRYFPIEDMDFNLLLELLKSDKYRDLEISTLKIFRENYELMEDYGILDEYELHNLLRKIVDDDLVKFGRMPMLTIGNGNRIEQIQSLLKKLAPISPEELACEYEKIYGARSKSILSYYFNDLSKYLHNGYYYLDLPRFNREELELLEENLNKDFYTIEEVNKIFEETLGYEDIEKKTNKINMKELGYLVFSSYMIKEEFESGVDYIRNILNEPLIVLDEIDKDLKNLPIFQSELYSQRYDFKLIEYKEGNFINIEKLEEKNINKKDIKSFADEVYNFVGEEVFNMFDLRNRGFKNKFSNIDFDNFFYESILASDSRFASRRLEGCRIFRKDTNKLVVNDIVKEVLKRNGPMDLNNLKKIIWDEYRINIDSLRLKYEKDEEIEYCKFEDEIKLINYGS